MSKTFAIADLHGRFDPMPAAIAPERLWLSAADADNEHEVWFEPDEGGTSYVRADLASRPTKAEQVIAAVAGMKRIVEEIDGAMAHGTWRDEHGVRLKDTPEWVALYNAIPKGPEATALPAPDLAGCKIALEQAWASNREREADIQVLRKALTAAGEELALVEIRIRDKQPERALGAAMCGQRDIAQVLSKAEGQP